MNQVEALKKLISAKTIKIRNLEIENKALKKQLGKVAQELLNTRRRAEIEHARVRKAEKGLKKIKKILNKKAGSSQALSQVQEEVSAVLRSLNENFFEGVFFYTGRMAEFGENTGVGVSLTEIIKEIATPDKPYQYYVALVNAIVARFGQMMVQNMWRNRYQKQAAGYNTPGASMYITSASFGKSLFEAFELLAEQTNTLEDMVWSKDVITSKEELEQMVANAQAAEAKAAAK